MAARVTLRDLFPDVSEQQLDEIAETLHGYCAAVWRIYERLERHSPGVVDDLMETAIMKAKVDSSKTN